MLRIALLTLILFSLLGPKKSPAGEIAAAQGDRSDGTSMRGQQVTSRAVSGGKWHSEHQSAGDKRDWHVQLEQRSDDSLSGRIVVVGGAVSDVRFEGQVTDADVYGVLLDQRKQQVGTFQGHLGKHGARGTYRLAGGDTGQWETDGAD